jgi:hypothetical protein
MHFTKYNWNITLYFAWEFWFTNSELYWIGHWYHITSICEGFHEPNSKAFESWNYMMCFVIWPLVNLIPRTVRRHVCEIIKKACAWCTHRQNAWNRISETLDFNIFRGGACTQTPIACLTPSAFDLCLKNPRSAPDYCDKYEIIVYTQCAYYTILHTIYSLLYN